MNRFLQRAAIVLIAALAVVIGSAFLFGGVDRAIQTERGAPFAQAPDRRAPVLDDEAAQTRSTLPSDVTTETSRSSSTSRASGPRSRAESTQATPESCLPPEVIVVGGTVDCEVFAAWETCTLPNGVTIWSPLRCDELLALGDVCAIPGAVVLGTERCQDALVSTSSPDAPSRTTASCALPDGREIPGGTCDELGIPPDCLADLTTADCDVWRDDGSGILGIDNPSAASAAAAASASAGHAADATTATGVSADPDQDALAATRGHAVAATVDGSPASADLSLSSTAALDSASVSTDVDRSATATPATYAWLELYGETTSYVVETPDGPVTVSVSLVVERDGSTAVVRRHATSSLGRDASSTATVTGDLTLTVDEQGPAVPADDDPLLAGNVVRAVDAAVSDDARTDDAPDDDREIATDTSLWARVRTAATELLDGLTSTVRSLLAGEPEDIVLDGAEDLATPTSPDPTASPTPDPDATAVADADAATDADANRTGAAGAAAGASAAGASTGDGATSDASTSTSTTASVESPDGDDVEAAQDGDELSLEPAPTEQTTEADSGGATDAEVATTEPSGSETPTEPVDGTSEGETGSETHDQTTVTQEPTTEPSPTPSESEGEDPATSTDEPTTEPTP